MIGETGFPLVVEVDLTGERMTVTAGDSPVAEWDLEKIRIAYLSDGFHIKAEGEEIILNFTDGAGFAEEAGVSTIHPA